MWIQSLQLDSFGGRSGLVLGGLSSGVNVIYGTNEAGKTTLMEAVRAVFFGFLDRRSNRNRYELPHGGERRIRLNLALADGAQWQLDRTEGTAGLQIVDLATGSAVPESRLRDALHHAERSLYESVFAFSLNELTDLVSLENSMVLDRLMGVALGAGSVSPSAVLKELQEQREKLFKARGKKNVIVSARKALEEAQGLIKGLGRNPREYEEIVGRLEHARRQRGQLRRAQVAIDTQIARTRRLLECRTDWDAVAAAEREAQQLLYAAGMPVDALAKMDSALAQKLEADERKEEQGREVWQIEKELSLIDVSESLESLLPQLDSFLQEGSAQANFPQGLARDRKQVEDAEQQTEQRRLGCGHDWNPERAEAVQDPRLLQSRARALFQRVDKAEGALVVAQDKLRTANEELGRLKEQHARAKKRQGDLLHLKAVPPDASERISHLNGEVEAAEARQRSEQEEATRARQQAEALEVDQALANKLDVVGEARTRLKAHGDIPVEIDRLRSELVRQTQETQVAVERSGEGLAEEQILRLSEAPDLASEINSWLVSCGETLTNVSNAEQALEDARDQFEAEEKALLQLLDPRWGGPDVTPREEELQDELDQQSEGLKRFQRAVDDLRVARARRVDADRRARRRAAAAEERQQKLPLRWDEKRILGTPATGVIADEIRSWTSRLATAEFDARQATQERARGQDRVTGLEKNVRELESSVGAEPEEMAVDLASARMMRQWLKKDQELKLARQHAAAVQRQLEAEERGAAVGASSALPLWVLVATVVVGVTVAGVLVGYGQLLAGALVGGAALVLVGLLAVHRAQVRRREQATEASRNKRVGRIKQQLVQQQEEVTTQQRELEALGRELPDGLTPERGPVQGELDRFDSRLEQSRQRQRQQDRLEGLREQLEQERHLYHDAVKRAEARVTKQKEEQQGWRAWASVEMGLEDERSPQQAAAFLSDLHEVQVALRAAQEAQSAAANDADDERQVEGRVREIMGSFGREGDVTEQGLDDLQQQWAREVRGLDQSLDRLGTLQRAAGRLASVEQRFEVLRERREAHQEQWRRWIEQQGIPADPSPEEAQRSLAKIREAADALHDRTQGQEALRAAEERWAHFCTDLFKSVDLEALDELTGPAIAEAVETLYDRCGQAAKAARERLNVLKEAQEAAGRAEREKRKVEEHSRRRDGLLQEWGFKSVMEFNAARDELAELTDLTRSIPGQERDLTTAEERRDQLSRAADDAVQLARKAARELDEFIERNQLTRGLDRDGLTNLIDAIGDYKLALADLDSERLAEAKALKRWGRMLGRYLPLLEAAGLADDIQRLEHAQVIGRIRNAVEQLNRAREETRKRSQKQHALALAAGKLEKLSEAAQDRKTKLEDLIGSVGATSEDDYRRWSADAEHLRQLRQKIAEKSAAILAALDEKDMEAVQVLLRAVDWTQEVAKLEQLETDRDALISELNELTENIGRDEERQRLHEQSEELARYRQDEATAQAQLEQAAEEWLIWTTAVVLVEKAREKFERERQPEVLRRASGYFAQLTNGAYTDIHVRLGEREMRAVGADGTRVPLLHLSRGTVEPLYLALRLALIDDFAGDGNGAPPVLMDDILVNFDDTRASHAAAAVQSLGQRTQILLLTCHQRTVENFESLGSDANIVHLNDQDTG